MSVIPFQAVKTFTLPVRTTVSFRDPREDPESFTSFADAFGTYDLSLRHTYTLDAQDPFTGIRVTLPLESDAVTVTVDLRKLARWLKDANAA